MGSPNTENEKISLLEKYASSVGQTMEVMKSYYVYFNPQQLANTSIETTNVANALLTDGLASPLDCLF